MAIRIDIGNAVVVPLEVQAVRRDGAFEKVQRSVRRSGGANLPAG
jgi:hypothetical protein